LLANVGYGALWITFGLSLYSIIASVIGMRLHGHPAWIQSACRSLLFIFPTISLSITILIILLTSGHYEIAYVSRVTSNAMPLFYKIAALWGGQSGSILFWTWLLSIVSFLFFITEQKIKDYLLPWMMIIISVTLVFFVFLLLMWENPFNKLWLLKSGDVVAGFLQPLGSMLFVPKDGNGLNPLLRHLGMVFHPPMLYLGLVLFVIPYAYLMAALITNRMDDGWVKVCYHWILMAWLFLSLGLMLGARWAYDVLGWGGYWGWDPIEIAALVPWLSATAYIHSSIAQTKRGLLRRWNILLIILTYSFVIFGSFLSRSGLLTSVHAFANSTVGIAYFIFVCLILFVSLGLLISRWESLEEKNVINSLLSREVMFIFANFLFVGLIVICLWGMLFPIFSEIIVGEKVTVGPPYYEKSTSPVFIFLLFLMGITPFISWKKGSLKGIKRESIFLFVLLLPILVGMKIYNIGDNLTIIYLGFAFFILFLTILGIYKDIQLVNKKGVENSNRTIAERIRFLMKSSAGKFVHIGVILITFGIIGVEMLQVETQTTVTKNEQIVIREYTLQYLGLSVFNTSDGRNISRAVLKLSSENKYLGELYPRRDYYYDSQQTVTIPAVRSTWRDDLYIILVDWAAFSDENITLRVYHNPFAMWLWVGSIIFIFGTLLLLFPKREDANV